MSEEPVAQQVTEAVPADKPGGLKGFFATTVGKFVIIGGAVGILAAIIGVVAFLLLSTFVTTTVEDLGTTTAGGSAAATVTAGAVEATVAPVADIGNRDVFTPRNPFEPVKAPASAFVDPNAGSSGGTDADTLFLEKIIDDGGLLKAVLWLGSNQYVLAEGEAISGTPWRVDKVRSGSITMQYGDEYVVLWPGGGVTK